MTARTIATAALAALLAAGTAGAPALAGPPHCPPGHAKKGWCTPGAKVVYRRGDRIPRDRYVVIADYGIYGYPAPPAGHAYVQAAAGVFLIAVGTGLVIDALR